MKANVGINIKGRVWDRFLVELVKPAPLLGTVFIGVIDRGTNVLQVRPTTLCPLNCIFCSVDAGPRSKWRQSEYTVGDPQWLAEWAGLIANFKDVGVEALIDGVGDPFTYPKLVELVKLLKEKKNIKWIAVETHGWALTKEIINQLENAGLDRINLSIDTLNPEKAKILTGTKWYNLERIIEAAEYLVKETSIDLHVTPVWIPGINDKDVEEVVEWAYKIGAGKKWPPATIQKYNLHRYGRRVPHVRPLSWREFWRRLEEFERRTGLKITWSMKEWRMVRRPKIPLPYRRGSRLRVKIAAPGWMRGTLTGVTLDNNWLITVKHSYNYNLTGRIMTVRIVEAYDTIMIGEPV